MLSCVHREIHNLPTMLSISCFSSFTEYLPRTIFLHYADHPLPNASLHRGTFRLLYGCASSWQMPSCSFKNNLRFGKTYRVLLVYNDLMLRSQWSGVNVKHYDLECSAMIHDQIESD
jgi:hypothetical protein